VLAGESSWAALCAFEIAARRRDLVAGFRPASARITRYAATVAGAAG